MLPAIRAYTLALAESQDRYGTQGHGGAMLNADGSFNGTATGYGPVNSAGLVCNIAIVLGRKAIVAGGGTVDPAIDAGIFRASKLFGFYVQNGNIPYGEHEPWPSHGAANGKEAMAGVMFALLGDQPVAAQYFSALSVSDYIAREVGHTGVGFNYLWSPLGAAMGGTNAAAAYLAPSAVGHGPAAPLRRLLCV